MNKKRSAKPDDRAEDNFITENSSRGGWDGDAAVQIALIASELRVLWPPVRGVGRDTDLVANALEALSAGRQSPPDSAAIFAAGKAFGILTERLSEFQKRAKGSKARDRNRPSNTAFYAIADRLVAEGMETGKAHLVAKEKLAAYCQRVGVKPSAFGVPDLGLFTKHLSDNRKRGV
jgi:hypothetical protein